MRILLTGSSGWLGQTLAARLERDGHHVVGLDGFRCRTGFAEILAALR